MEETQEPDRDRTHECYSFRLRPTNDVNPTQCEGVWYQLRQGYTQRTKPITYMRSTYLME